MRSRRSVSNGLSSNGPSSNGPSSSGLDPSASGNGPGDSGPGEKGRDPDRPIAGAGARASTPVVDEVGLLRRAREVRMRAYAPYSGFRVGAVVLTADGAVFEGVNVENASYRLTSCAEQAAICAMVTAGGGQTITALAVVGDGADPCTPCGACRQTIHEFGPSATILASGDAGRPVATTLADLLPQSFGAARLAQGRQDGPW